MGVLSAAWNAVTGAGGWSDVADEALKLGGKIMDALSSKEQRNEGATAQRESIDEATLDTINRVNAPISQSESDELWNRNKARYGSTDSAADKAQ